MEGISNKTIAIFFTEKTNYVKKNLLFFLLKKKFFLNFHSMMIESKSNYPF